MGLIGSKQNGDLITLSEKDISIIRHSTHFNEEEIFKYHKIFIETCPNGQIKRKSFIKLFKEFQPTSLKNHKDVDSYCEYIFNAFDCDSVGHISFQELLIALSITSYGDLKERVQLAFKIFDLDKNNVIDKNEMYRVIENLYNINGIPKESRVGENSPVNRVDTIMRRLDTNHDGHLSVDEFIDGCLSDDLMRQFLIKPLFG